MVNRESQASWVLPSAGGKTPLASTHSQAPSHVSTPSPLAARLGAPPLAPTWGRWGCTGPPLPLPPAPAPPPENTYVGPLLMMSLMSSTGRGRAPGAPRDPAAPGSARPGFGSSTPSADVEEEEEVVVGGHLVPDPNAPTAEGRPRAVKLEALPGPPRAPGLLALLLPTAGDTP